MTGSLRVKKGVYYAVISYKDSFGKYKQKWISTRLKERGNKKEAQRFLREQLETFNPDEVYEELPEKQIKNDIVFVDYIEQYVKNKKTELTPAVYYGYSNQMKIIKEFFGDKLKLKDVTYHHILDFYDYLRKERGNKNITIKHHATILSPALRQAYRDDLIPKNPYEFMPHIKREKSRMNFYNKEELEELFKITDKTNMKLIVRVASFYGFRRSELIGLKWEAIDFENKLITIQHKVLSVRGKIYLSDTLKTASSHRTLPLLPEIEQMLVERKQKIEHNKKMFGKSYNYKYVDYVFVDDIGEIVDPNIVTRRFAHIINEII